MSRQWDRQWHKGRHTGDRIHFDLQWIYKSLTPEELLEWVNVLPPVNKEGARNGSGSMEHWFLDKGYTQFMKLLDSDKIFFD